MSSKISRLLPPPRREAASMLAAILLTVASRLLYTQVRGFGAGPEYLYDDALITLRYARNLAAGLGLVYNPGEPVLGTSSPLYALLMAVPTFFGLDTIWSAILFNVGCDAAICLLLIRLGRGWPLLQALAPLLFLLHTNILYWSGTGMEFSLLVLLTWAAVALFAAERQALAGVVAAFALVGRLDALIFFAGFATVALCSRRRIPWRFLAGLVATATPFLIYAAATFGSVTPLSARARYLLYASPPFSGHALEVLLGEGWLVPALFGAFFVWLPLVRPEAWTALEKTPPSLLFFLRVLSLHPVFFLLAYELSGGQLYRRYHVAIEASLVALAAFALAFLVAWLRQEPASRRQAAAVAALLLCAFCLYRPIREGVRYPWRQIPRPPNSVHLEVARWLRAQTPENALVMAGNIGYIGYFSGRRIFDSNGLVSPAAFAALEAKGGRESLVDSAAPDYLALDPDELAALRQHLEKRGYRVVFELRYPPQPEFVYRILAR